MVSVARVNARRAPQGVRRASCPSVLEPAKRCPRWRRRASEIGTYTVKAAPADEARAVRHTRRREALALELLRRGLCGRCESDAAIGW